MPSHGRPFEHHPACPGLMSSSMKARMGVDHSRATSNLSPGGPSYPRLSSRECGTIQLAWRGNAPGARAGAGTCGRNFRLTSCHRDTWRPAVRATRARATRARATRVLRRPRAVAPTFAAASTQRRRGSLEWWASLRRNEWREVAVARALAAFLEAPAARAVEANGDATTAATTAWSRWRRRLPGRNGDERLRAEERYVTRG